METIPFTAGMTDLLTFISQNKSTIDCIVISDSNTMFIEWILHAASLQVAVDQVFTNPAVGLRTGKRTSHHRETTSGMALSILTPASVLTNTAFPHILCKSQSKCSMFEVVVVTWALAVKMH